MLMWEQTVPAFWSTASWAGCHIGVLPPWLVLWTRVVYHPFEQAKTSDNQQVNGCNWRFHFDFETIIDHLKTSYWHYIGHTAHVSCRFVPIHHVLAVHHHVAPYRAGGLDEATRRPGGGMKRILAPWWVKIHQNSSKSHETGASILNMTHEKKSCGSHPMLPLSPGVKWLVPPGLSSTAEFLLFAALVIASWTVRNFNMSIFSAPWTRNQMGWGAQSWWFMDWYLMGMMILMILVILFVIPIPIMSYC